MYPFPRQKNIVSDLLISLQGSEAYVLPIRTLAVNVYSQVSGTILPKRPTRPTLEKCPLATLLRLMKPIYPTMKFCWEDFPASRFPSQVFQRKTRWEENTDF